MNFFTELKRRNVFRAAGLYLVGAWLLIQVASTMLPAFDAPTWVLRSLIITLAVCFIPALIFSWVFELTPQGLKRDEDVSPAESIAPQTARRMDRLIIVVLVLALGYFCFDKFVLAPRREAARVAAATLPNEHKSAIPAKSIAVLPFENLSDEKANAYFAEGIQDEILTRLSKVAELKVISRTSTEKYKSAPDNLREVGSQLGVAHLLEGSVQKAGDEVHINVQLIDAGTDAHLWAESYNRKLDDIFGVEGEVATAIADQLKAKLTGDEKESLAAKPTSNPQAYDAYLRGLALAGRPDLVESDQREAIQSFETAVKLDPNFALAWAWLSGTNGGMFFTSDASPARRDATYSALQNALRLQPDLVETRLAQAYYHYFVERDYDAARKIFEQVQASSPNNSAAPLALGLISRRQGRWDESISYFNQAADLDPRNLTVLFWTSDTYAAMRQFSSALKFIDRALDIAPADVGAMTRKAEIYLSLGEVERADAILGQIQPDNTDEGAIGSLDLKLTLEHSYSAGITMMQSALAKLNPAQILERAEYWFFLGEFQRLSGNPTTAKASYAQSADLTGSLLREQPENAELASRLSADLAGLGERDAALKQAQLATEKLPATKDAFLGPNYEEELARVLTRFGEKDRAVAMLQHLLVTPYHGAITPALLRLDPDWDNLRDDPRFQKLANQPLEPTK